MTKNYKISVLLGINMIYFFVRDIKTAKNSGFFEELLSRNDFEAVLIIFCCYEYIILSMLLRQFRGED